MYIPGHFLQTGLPELQGLMRAHPLATLVSSGEGGPCADLIPLELDAAAGPQGTLRGHVARANPLWRQAAGQPVLALFHGPQTYITPSWYATKAATHKVVPTWNYTVVQAEGVLQVVEDAPWLHALVSRLTDHHEAQRASPWAVADAPADYVQAMLRGIVGIELAITRLTGKWKISQNRSAEDRAGVARGLAADGRPPLVDVHDLDPPDS